MKTSLKDIAEKLHLSKTTISWVLSGQGDKKSISATTQKKIFDCAKAFNYQPNLLARSLNTGISKTIGLIIPDITNTFYSSIAHAIEINLEQNGYSLMIGSSESDIERENKMIRLFRGRQVDGLIIAPTKISKVEIQNMVDEGYPLVLFDRYFPEMKSDYVIIDNEKASYELVCKMIEKGAKKIAILTTNPYPQTINMRHDGYARAITESNLALNPDLYGEVPFIHYEEEVYKTLDHIFAKTPDVDGFFFTTHILALLAFRYFFEHKIKFNSRFQLACIHSTPELHIVAPNMFIAQMPIEDIGKNTVDILLKRIQSRNSKAHKEESKENLVLSCTIR